MAGLMRKCMSRFSLNLTTYERYFCKSQKISPQDKVRKLWNLRKCYQKSPWMLQKPHLREKMWEITISKARQTKSKGHTSQFNSTRKKHFVNHSWIISEKRNKIINQGLHDIKISISIHCMAYNIVFKQNWA